MTSRFSQSILLTIQGGGFLEIQGSLESKKLFLILGRDNFTKEDPFTNRLIDHLVDRQQTVLWYESAAKNTQRLLNVKFPARLPKPIRWFLKVGWVLMHPRRWKFLFGVKEKIPFRCGSLRALLRFLGPQREIFLLTRSANGRVASLIADEAGVQKIVCLGYPFQALGHHPDPSRFEHLAALKTPLLIIQGVEDPYNGGEVLNRYAFSPNTKVRMVDTDHDFHLSEIQQEEIMSEIDDFIFF